MYLPGFGPLAPKFYPQLGDPDLFNDIVGSIVPGWDSRPQWMKDVKVKITPEDAIRFAKKNFPKQAAQVETAVQQAGAYAAPYAKDWGLWYAGKYARERAGEMAKNPWVWGGLAIGGIVIVGMMMAPGRRR